jgi:hypothetical protein
VDANYTISYVSGTLTVSPAALTITAANASKVYGAALPTLTATYSGFVNGDSAGSLTKKPTLSTTATASSAVGSYPITAGGAVDSNYTLTYVSGTLVVSKASTAGVLSSSANPSQPGQAVKFTLSLSAAAPGAGTPTGTVQFAVDGAAAGAPVSLSGGAASYTASNLAQGSHTISGQYAGSASFLGTTNQLTQSVRTGGPGHHNVVVAGGANPPPPARVVKTPPVAATVAAETGVGGGLSRNLAIRNLGNGSVAISGRGAPGGTYLIEYRADSAPATNWLTLGAVNADASGAFVLVENLGPGRRFYRVVNP